MIDGYRDGVWLVELAAVSRGDDVAKAGARVAESVGSSEANEPGGVFEHLTRLVDKSLVQVDQSGPEARFRFLETVRQFLFARLEASGEATATSARHMAHFLTLAEDLAPRLALSDGPDCLARLQAEFHNLEGALSFAHASLARNDLLRFVVALSLFYELRGHFALGWRWFERALSLDGEPGVLRARALWGAAHVCFYGGRYPPNFYESAKFRGRYNLLI